MDSADDDFGEVYIIDKVQACPLVAGDEGFAKSSGESERAASISDSNKPESQGEVKKSGTVDEESSLCVDDCAVNRSEVKEATEFTDSESDDDLNIVLKDDDSKALPNVNNGVEASQICSFQKPWISNWSTRSNGRMVNGGKTMGTSVDDNVYTDPSLGMLHSGYNFSHPWSRMNFDVFEKKPWRNPGAGINDYFNFGFNEQSWGEYCKSLGRAIEVGGGTLERIPSAELCRPREADPDVVIQIPVTNDVEELSSVILVEARSPGITSNEGSRREDLDSFNGSVKEEALGCQDKNTGSSSGEQSPSKEKSCSREVTPCDEKMVDEEKEENCSNSDESVPSSVERETSLGDRIRFSPTPSCSAGKSQEFENSETESSKGSDSDDQREVISPPRPTRFTEHEAISTKNREKSGREHSRDRRSHEYRNRRHFRRVDYAVHRRTEHRLVRNALPSPDPDLGKKMRYHHGSLYRDSRKNWWNGPRSLEKDETEDRGFPHSNRDKYHGELYPSVDRDRHGERRSSWHSLSRGQGLDHSNGYKYEAHLKEYTSRSPIRLDQRNFRSSFKEEKDQYGRQHCERRYGSRERDRFDWLRAPYYQDRIPIADKDYRYQFEYSSVHGRHNPKQSHENDLHCRRRGDYDYNLHCQRYEDGVHRAGSGIPFELAYREFHSFDEVGRREFQMYERHEEFLEIDRRHHYTPDRHLDRFVSEKDGFEHRVQDAWPSQSLSFRDSWYARGARGDSWKDDTRDFTRRETYDRQNSQLYKAAQRDGWARSIGHGDNVSIHDRLTYEDDWVHPDRERYKSADDIQCSMREVTHFEYPSYTDEVLVRDIRMPIHNRMSTKQTSGYFKSHSHENDERHHRSKKQRVGRNAFIKREDPVGLTGRQRKLSNQSKRRFGSGGATIEEEDHQKPRKIIFKSKEKTVKMQDLNGKEEGEIAEERSHVKGIEINEERIQESLKKMEKRKERFKDIGSATTLVASTESQTKPEASSDDIDQLRPIRKRRWCAS